MRLNLLSSVSVVAMAVFVQWLAVPVAQAGFEFVPSQRTPTVPAAPDRQETMDMPAVSAPIVSEEPVEAMPAPAVVMPAPARIAPAPVLAAPVRAIPPAPVASPVADRPIPVAPAPVSSPAAMPPAAVEAPMRIAPAPAPLMNVVRTSDALVEEPIRAVPSSTPYAAAPQAVTPSYVTNEDNVGDNAVVEGFGRDVPLVLALQQIVPANYRYSFDGDIQPGTRVDWSGGKPWKDIIIDLARDNGMHVDIVSNVVAFRRKTPMDIIDANTAIDFDMGVVQGIRIREPMPVMPAPMESVSAEPIVAAAPTRLVPEKESIAWSEAAPEVMPAEVADAPVAAPTALVAQKEDIAWSELPPLGMEEAEVSDEMAVRPTRNDTDVHSPVVQELASMTDQPFEPAVQDEKRDDLARQLEEARASAQPAAAPQVVASTASSFSGQDTPAAAPIKEKMILTEEADTASEPMVLATAQKQQVVDAPASVQWETEPAAGLAASDPVMPLPIVSAPPVSEAPEPTTIATTQQWEARKNDTLRQVLTAWSEQSGVSLVWSSEYDYPLQTDVRIDSDYSSAVRTLLAGFAKAQPRPVGRLFNNKEVGAQPVLVVETQRLTD